MTIIKQIKLENFQGHKNKIIDLHACFNAIIGESDKGKSSIGRAYRWVFHGLRGNFIHYFWDGKDRTAKVEFILMNSKNDISVARERNADINDWLINQNRIVKPGKVPNQLKQIVKNSFISADDRKIDICFQHQNDGFFLVDESPTARALLLDEISGVFVVDQAIKKANSELKNSKKEKEQKQLIIDDLLVRIKNKNAFIDMNVKLEEIETQAIQAHKEEEQLQHLTSAINQYKNAEQLIGKLPYIPELPKCDYTQMLVDLIRLNSSMIKFKTAEVQINKIGRYEMPDYDVGSETKSIEQLTKLNSALHQYRKADKEIKNTQNIIDKINNKLKDLQDIFNKIGKCKICGRPI